MKGEGKGSWPRVAAAAWVVVAGVAGDETDRDCSPKDCCCGHGCHKYLEGDHHSSAVPAAAAAEKWSLAQGEVQVDHCEVVVGYYY